MEDNTKVDLFKKESSASLKHPLSTSCARHGHNNDYLPSELLANLTSQFESFEDLGPQSNARLKKGKAFPKVYPKRPPDNLWNHSKTRERFKHLTDQPPCTCGAGRDISFLYDAVSNKNTSSSSKREDEKRKNDKVKVSPQTFSQEANDKQQHEYEASKNTKEEESQLPESLLPHEFHIVKNQGVLGLEIHDDKFTTTMDNHEKHLTLFPSMKPSGRQEAILLKKTMEDLLSRVGIYDLKPDEDQPTQIHALLELVKQEQNIYNVVFSEIIRQVTVECVERGELLADLRKRYAKLLEKVPHHVKSLHEEVLAQRALDRRLTEELTRFKTSITLLTRELDSVQEHDREVTKKAAETQNELNEALRESEKNASLLAEYHELYELQRKRLEFQISKLIEERDLWAGASYTLSIKVARKNNLKTAKRLHLHEKAWYKLAGHFAIILSDIDSIDLQKLTSNVQQWQDLAEAFNGRLLRSEKETFRKLSHLRKQVRYWGKQFMRVVTPDEGTVNPPEKPTIAKLYGDMKHWEEVFNSEIERFSGDILLSCEDDLLKMNATVDDWSEVALKIFRRHPNKIKDENRLEHELMLSLNKEIDKLHRHFKSRMTGENGLAKGIIHFINVLDTMSNKLNGFTHGAEVILDPEWVRLADFLQSEWDELLSELIDLVDHENKCDNIAEGSDENLSIHDVQSLSKSTHQWLTETSNSIDNADASILDHVSSNHSNMIRWMVTVLLRLAPDLDDDPFGEDENSGNVGIGSAIISESITEEIQEKAKLQFRRLRKLTNELFKCCTGVVDDNIKENADVEREIAEIEMKDLHKLKVECDGWINTAILLVEEFSGDKIKEFENEEELGEEDNCTAMAGNFLDGKKEKNEWEGGENGMEKKVSNIESSGKSDELIEKTNAEETEGKIAENKELDVGHRLKERIEMQKSNEAIQMHVIGHDENVELKMLDADTIAQEMTSGHNPSPLLEQKSSLDALGTIETLQKQLMETEERAQTMEERAIAAESNLKEALERIRALERSIRRASQDSTNQRPNSELASLPETNNNEESLPTTPKSRMASRGVSRDALDGKSSVK